MARKKSSSKKPASYWIKTALSIVDWIDHFPRRNRKFKGILLVVLLGVLLSMSYVIYAPMSAEKKPMTVAIPYGTNTRVISAILFRHHLIRNQEIFRFYTRVHRIDRHMRAGFFVLSPSQSMAKIASILGKEKSAGMLVRVTLPEGLTLPEIGELLEKKQLTTKAVFVKFAHNAKPIFLEKYTFLAQVPTSNLEGYLFPDTYLFAKGVDVSVMVNAFLAQFDKKIAREWANSTSNIKQKFTLHELVTMASIVESEAHKRNEMPFIASVFYNRYHKKMAFASDPTVLYALGKSIGSPVVYSNLKVDSPYNTYLHAGFPPTPIGAPGAASFKAAMHPAASPYLFFVADQEGGHLFTTTYEDHLRVQRELAKKRRKPS